MSLVPSIRLRLGHLLALKVDPQSTPYCPLLMSLVPSIRLRLGHLLALKVDPQSTPYCPLFPPSELLDSSSPGFRIFNP